MSSENPTTKAEQRTNLGEIEKAEALRIAYSTVEERRLETERIRDAVPGERLAIPKTLILVCGYEGSGKSHNARAIERDIPLVYIDKDPISDIFSTSRKNEVHQRTRSTAYEIMYALAGAYLKNGRSVILDAPFDHPDFFPNPQWVAMMQAVAGEHDAALKVVWCTASPEARLERIKKRRAKRDGGGDRTPEDIAKLAAKNTPPHIPFRHICLDTEHPDNEALADFLEVSVVERETMAVAAS